MIFFQQNNKCFNIFFFENQSSYYENKLQYFTFFSPAGDTL